MDGDIVARVEDWEARPFSGGHAGLRDLAEREFTGAVTAGMAWAFMLNGRVIAVTDGSMADFENADGTAYQAPHPAVALLFAMQVTGGETQAKYFTDDTPIKEAHQTLAEGNFVGYIELSENVLSGDYYIAYYGGRSLSAAFIGNEERLLTGDEAFERACDEVGIYEVRAVDIEVRDIPEPAGSDTASSGTSTEGGGTGTEPESGSTDRTGPGREAAPGAEPETAPDGTSGEANRVEAAGGAERPDADPASTADAAEPTAEAARPDDGGTVGPSNAANDPNVEYGPTPASGSGPAPNRSERASQRASIEEPDEERSAEESAWQETQTIPAIDPEESVPEEATDDSPKPAQSGGAQTGEKQAAAGGGPQRARSEADLRSRVKELEEQLEVREAEIEELKERLTEVTADRDELKSEHDRLAERIDELETRAGSAGGDAPGSAGGSTSTGRVLSQEEALTQTDLFVRYGSKGKATLEEAGDGSAGRSEVSENLTIETHTRFEAADVTVGDMEFRTFLEGTIGYRFVRWLIEDLLYEIQETGNEKALRSLYDALPRIDRAEFYGTIAVETEDGGHEEEFDVVCRDRMGQPLVVADINPERDPASGEMMNDLIEGATAVAEHNESLSAAFLVTASFFEPGALEAADEATGSGFLSRDARRSLVKLTRTDGYHLCLAEAREEAFHVAVPEL